MRDPRLEAPFIGNTNGTIHSFRSIKVMEVASRVATSLVCQCGAWQIQRSALIDSGGASAAHPPRSSRNFGAQLACPAMIASVVRSASFTFTNRYGTRTPTFHLPEAGAAGVLRGIILGSGYEKIPPLSLASLGADDASTWGLGRSPTPCLMCNT
jgi:hypothetical protein